MARRRTPRRPAAPQTITLCDSAGRVRIILGCLGNAELPTLQMNDSNERARATIQIDPDGRAVISLQASSGQGLIGLGADERGEIGFSLTRPSGLPVVSLSWSEAEGLRLEVWDHSGRPVWQGFEPGPRVGTRPSEASGVGGNAPRERGGS
jgi:hypothetical protein